MKQQPPDDAKPALDHEFDPTPLNLGAQGTSRHARVAPNGDRQLLNSTAILRTAMERSRNCLFPSLEQVLNGSGPYLKPLGTCMRRYLSEVLDNELARRAFGNALMDAGRSEVGSGARHALHQEARRVIDVVRRILQRASAAGECDPNLDPGVWAEIIGRTLFGSISSVAADHGRSMDTSSLMPAIALLRATTGQSAP
ncbi:TetR/AcrR family transcriptional regulator C-terminal ligand-binding domain-containing protein [Cupriavidus sp. AU9028]|uniref:TetR/AcrR family transcriptional regulator C-terminal ligand-binding domain-containing protein n=1 Tax=Cupriavidus sp. AU9028 TaxID=2871157 RepID=UPI001C9701DD|nr:TetR/AcrR family transcriptional regulator C-terminal ligand-binding domain-containing protein [Cupriavidus sp. AU9028]MBY4897089.1 TetR/AcrR family transcriptional regulator C-terminal ligand-binding domain-containing protein [Cupriavidus sp. AU9028]